MYALITGASEGIGRAIALALSDENYDLILCARRLEPLQALKKELQQKSKHIQIKLVTIDCGNKTELKKLIKEIKELNIEIGILVNNVGFYHPGSLFKETDEAFEEMLSVNLLSAYYLSKAFGIEMINRKMGHIFGISSFGGKSPLLGAGSYSVSKFALHALMLNLREELKETGVHVTSILPGETYTSSWQNTHYSRSQFIQAADVANALVNCLKMSPGANIDEVHISPQNFKNKA